MDIWYDGDCALTCAGALIAIAGREHLQVAAFLQRQREDPDPEVRAVADVV